MQYRVVKQVKAIPKRGSTLDESQRNDNNLCSFKSHRPSQPSKQIFFFKKN